MSLYIKLCQLTTQNPSVLNNGYIVKAQNYRREVDYNDLHDFNVHNILNDFLIDYFFILKGFNGQKKPLFVCKRRYE